VKPLDTSHDANEVQLNILRSMGGSARLKIAIELSEFARGLAFARIERDRPGLTKPQLIREFLHCVLSKQEFLRFSK
jgi:hypothetical protein